MISQDEVKNLFLYVPEAKGSNLIWKVDMPHHKVKGKLAGSPNNEGYWHIRIQSKLYKAHRLVWLLHNGVWPVKGLDHIDGNKNNNVIENLREATDAENNQNKKIASNNTSGYIGVSWHKGHKKWGASIRSNNKQHHLGYHTTPESAHNAYIEAKKSMHMFNPILRAA
jgi:hypothetical protein